MSDEPVRRVEQPSAGAAIMRVALNLIPGVGGAFAAAFDYFRELDRARVEQIAIEAAGAYGDDSELADRLTSDERFVDMMMLAFESGRRSSWEAKRIAMGRVLGQAMKDDADIDNLAALERALAALEAPHFHWLRVASTEPPQVPLSGHPIPEPYASQLTAQGVVQLSTTYDGAREITGVSPFGWELIEWIQDAEEPDAG